MDSFTYDKNQDFKTNFNTWYSMNCRERMGFNIETYDLETAKTVFAKLYTKGQIAKSA